MIELFETQPWQMTVGERAALDGVLRNLAPQLAVEIGTAEGGSLRCIAARSAEVHSFDVIAPPHDVQALDNVIVHTGDSHVLLPGVLSELAEQGRSVDFALVDGDHSTQGVRRDVEDLLASRAVRNCLILLHDTANEIVRAGIESIDYVARPKVQAVDLDFVPGYLVRAELFHHELWGGLGMIVVQESELDLPLAVQSSIAYPAAELLLRQRERLLSEATGPPAGPAQDGSAVSAELENLRCRNAELERRLGIITRSRSWQLTAPLRHGADWLRSR